MLSPLGLTTESTNLLQLRGLSSEQVDLFSDLLDAANHQLDNDKSAKQVLSSMSQDEMKLLQKATGLADPIDVNSLSTEGAANLLAQPDHTGMVDINNDGIVEIGKAKMVTFPPINAPDSVHQAWEKATEGMAEGEKMIMQFHMHVATYGLEINGQNTKEALPPEEQWSSTGWQQLLKELRSALEFSVAMDGWDRTNLVRQDFYDKFESELRQQNA
ncbi:MULTISPECIES: hypothetical protein [unclassified Neptuniibacter]|uniref:hypothetical protein n=1 Tax=unclassified Neptuniibacter TaxID=2630693 RepID=UPI0025F01F73|nr:MULTISPECIES: hypothetical protein [unclassified Neptuniibacter]|tara:strand:- start:2829 stop:3476 length:648 start_codon:yes stop_codon:yes gene_type:complete